MYSTKNAEYREPATSNEPEPRRGFDPIAMLFGLAALLAALYIVTDGQAWVPALDPRWLIAGGALLVGVVMLVLSTRSGRRRRG